MQREIGKLKDGPFDVVVIGGGIYGSWIACHAAQSGLKVALVEKDDWGSATSSSSSKLLHGGLRYLENYEFGLVRKSLHERRELNRLLPHQVRPLRFLLPVYSDSRVGRLKLKAGLWLYDRLAGRNQPVGCHQSFSAKQLADTEPYLSPNGLVGGFSYGDCATDDARMVLEVVDTAIRAGAAACNYVTAEKLLRNGDRVTGVTLLDNETDTEFDIQASIVVNAAGPWVFQQLGLDGNQTKVRLTKGVHLVMPAMRSDHAVLLTSRKDGRVFFLIPWYGRTLLGTTDTDYHGSPSSVNVEPEDIDYLLSAANEYVRTPWTVDDIHAAFVGLRTLQDEGGKSASKVSREWAFEETQVGLFTSVGGKYTSARVDAAMAVDTLASCLGRPANGEKNTTPMGWSPPRPFSEWRGSVCNTAAALGMDRETAESCARRYGGRITEVFALIKQRPELASRIVSDLAFCRAEVILVANQEMPRTLIDILRRRIPLLLLTRLDRSTVEDVATLASEVFGWDGISQHQQIEHVMAASESWRIGNGISAA